MKTIELQIPEGKKAEWINGVLTLVDDKSNDIRERIKTFQDAYCELGDNHPYVISYEQYVNSAGGTEDDVIAYLKLRIIVAALNEGWKPKFTKDECQYFVYLDFHEESEYENIAYGQKGHFIYRNSDDLSNDGWAPYVTASYVDRYGSTAEGARLALKTPELATYAGAQFLEIWADYMLPKPV